MEAQNANSRNPFVVLAAALVTFVAGFALAWILRGQTIVVAPADTPTTNHLTQDVSTPAATTPEQLPESPSAESPATPSPTTSESSGTSTLDEQGSYSSPEDVALYIHSYGHLPHNYISKTKARKAGWVANEGNLWDVLPGMSIGGSEFYNDEGLLPDAPGRSWTECDVNYQGGYRGAERLVFSSDGLIFYTDDHYKTFTQLY